MHYRFNLYFAIPWKFLSCCLAPPWLVESTALSPAAHLRGQWMWVLTHRPPSSSALRGSGHPGDHSRYPSIASLQLSLISSTEALGKKEP